MMLILVSLLLLVLILLIRLGVLKYRVRSGMVRRDYPLIEPDSKAIDRFKQLLRIAAVSHDDSAHDNKDSFRQAVRFIREEFPRLADVLEFHVLSDYAVYAIWQGSSSSLKPGLFLAHYDVVDAPAEGWRFPPFEAVESEGAIYARGALDDKNSLFGLMQAVEGLLEEGFSPQRSLYFAFGGDEECTGRRGAAVLAEEFRRREIRFAFALDEGAIVARNMLAGFSGSVGMIGVEEKGFVSLKISVAGTPGHASMPTPNAATHRLVRALARITARPLPARITPGLHQFLRALAPKVPVFTGLIFANLWLFGPLLKLFFSRNPRTDALIRTTVAVTILEGGYKDNVLPASASAVCNLRILPGDTVDKVILELQRRAGDNTVRIEPVDAGQVFNPVSASSTESTAYKAVRDSLLAAFPDAVPAPFLVNVTTDSKWYASLCDNLYRFVPMELDADELQTIHGVDEHISLENLTAGVLFYREVIKGVGNG